MYKLPENLSKDIDKFARLANGYQQQSVSSTEFKAFRVPMGIYEQRKSEVYMARIRATGGVITPDQLLSVIDIARQNGSDLLHITTRGEVQILNLQLDKVENVLQQLKGAELATKGGGGNTVRNIIVSEFSGIGKSEVFDATPYAIALTNAAVPEADSYLMPRKMKIAFSSDDKFVDYAGVNDIGLVAQIKDGKRGFKVYIGGGAGSKPSTGWLWREFLPAEDLYSFVKAMKNFFNAHGNRKDKYKARIRFIFYRLGQEETFRLIDDFFEKQKAEGIQLDVDPKAFEDDATVRPQVAYTPVSVSDEAAFATWKKRYVTPQRQEGYASVVLPITLGNIWLNDASNVDALKELLAFTGKFGMHTVRFTPKQNIRFRNIPEEALPELYQLIYKYVPANIAKPAIINNIVSCTGADTCRLGICLSKGLTDAIIRHLENSDIDLDVLQTARINITGCPNLCGQPLWSDLGFVGKVLHTDHVYPAYQVYVGANYIDSPALAQSIGTISAYDAPKFVVELVRKYSDIAGVAEALGQELSFGKWLRSDNGKAAAVKLLAKYKDIPLFAEDKNYYFDWGSDDVFNVTKRGKPECSAGLFDMIQVDQDSIKEARDKNPYNVIFHASRMLLVTRGLDPQDAAGVFDAFTDNFITTGYVDGSFKPLVEQAKTEGENGTYDNAQANALADAVTELYKGMDESLQFKTPDKASASPTTPPQPSQREGEPIVSPLGSLPLGKQGELLSGGEGDSKTSPLEGLGEVTRTKDLRGVLCPMNFVRTKLELATLQSGDTLEILLDDGKPIENVPGSVKLEGHEILSQTQHSEGYWQVLIKKK